MSKVKVSKQNWFLKHKVISIIGLIIIIGIAASATGQNASVTTTPSTSSSSSSHSSKPTQRPAATAHVGATLNIGGSKGLGVTLTQVVDPASGADQYTTAAAGKRFVAVEFKIVNNGTAAFSDDANNDVTLIGSDNQSYTPDFESVAQCTNFNDGQFTLTPAESSSGCVVYQLPNSISPAKVQFQTESGFSGSAGEWLVP